MIGRRVDGVVLRADERAREIVARAEEEANRLRAEVERDRAQQLEASRVEGYAAGMAQAAATLTSAAAARVRLLSGLERDLGHLALEVARRILGRELRSDPAAVCDLAATALGELRDERPVVLRVSPGDAPALRADQGRLAAACRGAGLEVREDPGIAAGGVIVETAAGRIDARVEAQLADLARALEDLGP